MRHYGLIGKKLNHSFSKQFFTEKFQKEQLSACYENIELADETELKLWWKNAAAQYRGVNITIPYKTAVLPLLDKIDEEAKEIGAVNTVLFQNGISIGYNTDAYGFAQSIKPFLRNIHERALLIGTGGAAKAVAFALRKLGITVAFLSRNPSPEKMIFGYDQATEIMVQSFPLIVNCSPVGMFPHQDQTPNFPIHFVGENHLVIDLIYNPEETIFLQTARKKGADTLNGLSMLQHQALQAWKIWNAS